MSPALETEPTELEPLLRVAAPRLAALEVCNEPDALFFEEAERIPTVAAPIEDQGERPRTVGAADLFHGAWDRAREGVVEGLREEEQRSSSRVVDVHVRVTLDGQAALGVPSLRRRLNTVVGAEVPVHVVETLPHRLEGQVALEEFPGDRHGINTLGKSLDLPT